MESILEQILKKEDTLFPMAVVHGENQILIVYITILHMMLILMIRNFIFIA